MLIYAATFIFLLSYSPAWRWIYTKDIIMWVIFAGVPVCFNAVSNKTKEHYFRKIFSDNIKFAVLVEFFISSFTFSLVAELILIPILIFLTLLQAVADRDLKYKSVSKLLTVLLSVLGLAVLGLTLRNAIAAYQDIGVIDLLVSFFTPIVFSLLYIPVAYLFAVYAKYELVFIRMGFKESKNWRVRLHHRWRVFLACGISIKNIEKFGCEYVKHMYVRMPETSFDDLLRDFKCERRER
jgi:hypothetical protein